MVLVGYWPLTEDSGGTAYDHSGNENHGALNEGVTKGKIGILGTTAYSFDGTDDYVEGTTGPTVTGSITISAWINVDSVGGYNTSFRTVVAKGAYSGADYALYIQPTDNEIVLTTNGNHENGIWSTVTGEWKHIVAKVDSNNNVDMYVDGSSISLGGGNGTVSATDNGGTFRINYDNYQDRYLASRTTEVRIYDHALTAAEIQYLYNVSKRGRQVMNRKTS